VTAPVAPAPPVLGDTAPFERLQLVQRVDWRFLLPSPCLGAVAYAGRPDAQLLEALERFGGPVAVVGKRDGTPRGSCDAAVAVNPTPDQLQALAGLLRPGGRLYLELHGRVASRRRLRSLSLSLRAVEDTLVGLGFEEVRAAWHFPDVRSCEEIVPLADQRTIRFALTRRRSTRLVRLKASLAGVLLSAGMFGQALPSRSVTARLSGGGGSSLDYLLSFLAEHHAGADLAPDASVLVTPRDPSSMYVVFLLLDRRSGEPSVVAKIARLPEYADRLAREAELLDAVQRTRPGGYDTIPRLVALGQREEHLVVVQTALVGRAIDHATMRRRRAECVPAVLAWLDDLPHFPDARAAEPAWYERLVEAPLERLAEALAGEAESLQLVERTRELLQPLRDAELPLVVEHGDVNHPNLIWLRDGRVGVVDWELAQLRGLPGHDLFFFLAYVSFAAERAWTERHRLRVFHETFLVPEAWARAPAARYAERLELPVPLLRPLFVACWARRTAGLVERVEGGALMPTSEPAGPALGHLRRSTAAYIQQNAYFALWRHALDHYERLDFAGGGGT
jgi:aminoglycoside phosphotransferase